MYDTSEFYLSVYNFHMVEKITGNSDNKLTLAAFVTVVLFLGVNFVAVKFSNQELQPFWGAALRFIIASSLLFAIVRVRNIPLPHGRALFGAGLYGLFSFAINFGFLYWALTRVSAGMASVMFASIPLVTLLMASMIGLEHLTWKGCRTTQIRCAADLSPGGLNRCGQRRSFWYCGEVFSPQSPNCDQCRGNVSCSDHIVGSFHCCRRISAAPRPDSDLAGIGMAGHQFHCGVCSDGLDSLALDGYGNFLHWCAYPFGDGGCCLSTR
jgi:hypothetical protein